jgi:hypothetical protein
MTTKHKYQPKFKFQGTFFLSCENLLMMLRFDIFFLMITFSMGVSSAWGQTKGINRGKYRVNIVETDQKMVIDGVLDEEPWQTADRAAHFQRVEPTDTGFAMAQTEVMLTYDAMNLYMGIICHDPVPGKRPVESLRRDFTFYKNDNFLVFIDTYNDYTNGFSFGVSAAGAQWDGIQANGGTVSLDWDIKWKSAVKSYEDRWTAEFSIPFRSIRYHGGVKEWGINFSRLDLKSNEKSSWAPMPRQFATATLAFTGTLVWDKPLEKAGPRFSLIPYASGKVTSNRSNGQDTKYDGKAGIDAKVILSTSLNLDLTINPDYSQVEVDRQQINLDRFELFFPEKRQFFLENSDLFANLGTTSARPFFSRRIGLNSPVDAGARLSGMLGEGWRIGVMDMQTRSDDGIQASNYAVAAVQKKVLRRSNLTGFFINRQLTEHDDDTASRVYRYNRVAGLEFNLASADNRWTGKAFYHQSFYPGSTGDALSLAANLVYSTQYLNIGLNQAWIGKDFLAEAGYIRRKGYYEANPTFQYKFYPASGRIVRHGPIVKLDALFDPDFNLTDRETQLGYTWEWKNRSVLLIDFREDFVELLAPFDPTYTGRDTLDTGTRHYWQDAGFSFTSDTRKMLNFVAGIRYGTFYNTKRFSFSGDLFYRVQPYGSLAISSTYYHMVLPDGMKRVDYLLIGPRLDITFTNTLFLTSYIQYNNQIDNMNLNIRFQWRFAPVSDLFIVYTDNYNTEGFGNKDRGLIIKLSYWFN